MGPRKFVTYNWDDRTVYTGHTVQVSLNDSVHTMENVFVSADTGIWGPRKPNYLPITDICPPIPITFYLADNFLSAQ